MVLRSGEARNIGSGYVALPVATSPRGRASVEMLPQIVKERSPNQDQLDIVQFATAIFVVDADEGSIQCDVMRIGHMKGSLSFSYSTESMSAMPDRLFKSVSGRLEMEPGQYFASIEVQILKDTHWNPLLEFKVILSEPDGCRLGQHLKISRIKVIEDRRFPSDGYKEFVDRGDEAIEQINPYGLFGSFTYLMLFSPDCWWRTLLTLFLDQLNSFYLYIRLKVGIYMVDEVFNGEGGESVEDRVRASYRLAFWILAPMMVLYLAEEFKIRVDLKGHLSHHLQNGIFRMYMNYNTKSLNEIPQADMIASLTQDVHELAEAYSKVLQIAGLAGKLSVFIFFTLHQNPGVWPIAVLVPILMIIWGCKRVDVFMEARIESEETEAALVRFVHGMISRLGIVFSYHARSVVSDLFSRKAEDARAASMPEKIVSHNNVFVTTVMGPALVALYTAIASGQVVRHQLSQGVFLATISVFGDICTAFSEVFRLIQDLTSRFYYLKRITSALNKETVLPALKQQNREHIAETKQAMMSELKKSASSGSTRFVPAADRLDIAVKNMTFAHPGQTPIEGLVMANLSCPQGRICSVVGRAGKGASTLLDLLGQKIFPSQGIIFTPSHLRILLVSADPVLLNISAWQNLVFGNPKGSDPYRVERILRRLKMDSVLALCAEELEARKKEVDLEDSLHALGEKSHEDGTHDSVDKGVNPLEKLSGTTMSSIHIARALIANPEVMVMHSPFMHFPKRREGIEHMRQALLEHRDNRGLEMSPETIDTRRPRTIFFNPQSELEDNIADLSWVMPSSPGGKIEVVWKSNQNGAATSEQPRTTSRDAQGHGANYEESFAPPHKWAPSAHDWPRDYERRDTRSAPRAHQSEGRYHGEPPRYSSPARSSSTHEQVVLL